MSVATWKLTEGSMLERSVAAGAVYVSYADYKALQAKVAELEATIESQNHYLEFIHEECRKTARACGAEVSDRTQAGDANVAARQVLKKRKQP